jgi:hypothetical protein
MERKCLSHYDYNSVFLNHLYEIQPVTNRLGTNKGDFPVVSAGFRITVINQSQYFFEISAEYSMVLKRSEVGPYNTVVLLFPASDFDFTIHFTIDRIAPEGRERIMETSFFVSTNQNINQSVILEIKPNGMEVRRLQ